MDIYSFGKVRTVGETVQIRLNFGDSASDQLGFRRNIRYIHDLGRGVKKLTNLRYR